MTNTVSEQQSTEEARRACEILLPPSHVLTVSTCCALLLCLLAGVLWRGRGRNDSLAWVTHVSESGHRLLIPLFCIGKCGDLRAYRCGGRMLFYDRNQRQVQLGPQLFIAVELHTPTDITGKRLPEIEESNSEDATRSTVSRNAMCCAADREQSFSAILVAD